MDGTLNDNICKFYVSDAFPTVMLASCPHRVDPLRCHDWATCLLQHITFNELIVLDGMLQSEYKTSNLNLQPPFVRCLKTEAFSKQYASSNKFASVLEPPNVVSGVGASVLSKVTRNFSITYYLVPNARQECHLVCQFGRKPFIGSGNSTSVCSAH